MVVRDTVEGTAKPSPSTSGGGVAPVSKPCGRPRDGWQQTAHVRLWRCSRGGSFRFGRAMGFPDVVPAGTLASKMASRFLIMPRCQQYGKAAA